MGTLNDPMPNRALVLNCSTFLVRGDVGCAEVLFLSGFVCLLIPRTMQKKHTEWITTKLGGKMLYGSGKSSYHFGASFVSSTLREVFFPISVDFSENNLWIVMRKLGIFRGVDIHESDLVQIQIKNPILVNLNVVSRGNCWGLGRGKRSAQILLLL